MAANLTPDRPDMPEGYGVPENDDGLVEWPVIDRRLGEAMHYWLATTRADGRPHVVPRWGVWLDAHLYYDGSPDTVHARNAEANPACTLHIGEGADAIILDGTSVASEPVTGHLGTRIATAIGAKYGELGYRPEPDAWSDEIAGGLRVFTPNKALAWFDFPNDLTRYRFG